MTREQKRKVLARYVEVLVTYGYDITDIMGRPLAYFNYEYIPKHIFELENQEIGMDNEEYHVLEQEYLDQFGLDHF